MDYDEDLLVELIACGDVSQTEIAKRVGVSRRTVWRIANGHSRPDLQTKIADTVEGFRRETIRMAAKWMKPLLTKQIKVALEEDGETARKSREFLLKTFMIVLPEQAAKAEAKREPDRDNDRQSDGITLYNSLVELSPDLKHQVVEELGGPAEDSAGVGGVYEGKEEIVDDLSPVPDKPFDEAQDKPVSDRKGKEVAAPFANFVDGPFGKKVYAASIRAVEEARLDHAQDNPPPKKKKP